MPAFMSTRHRAHVAARVVRRRHHTDNLFQFTRGGGGGASPASIARVIAAYCSRVLASSSPKRLEALPTAATLPPAMDGFSNLSKRKLGRRDATGF